MRIVDEKPYEFEFTCSGCQSTLVADADDITMGRFGVKDEYERRYYAACPICGTLKFLPSASVPPKIRDTADRKAQS